MGDCQQNCSVLLVISVVLNKPLSLNDNGHLVIFNFTISVRKRSSCTNENLPVRGGFLLKIGPREYLSMKGGIILQQEVTIPIAG